MIDKARIIRDLIEREDYTQAWPLASEFLTEEPDNPKALYLCAAIMRSMEHVGVALNLIRRALAFDPGQPNLLLHYGALLHETLQREEARQAFQKLLAICGEDPKLRPYKIVATANMGSTYVEEGQCSKAILWADKALMLDPNNRTARVAKAFGSLGLGKWSEGWEHAEALYGEQLRIRIYNPPEREEPMWDGSKGKTVVVQADQGLGDMIMFSQCLPEMVRDCKKVIVETNSRLVGLFKRNFPECDVYGTLKQMEGLVWPSTYEIDAHVHISYLGKFYRKANEDFPRKAYISADPEKRKKWREWLSQFPKPWVGIAWKGGIQKTNEKARSMKLEELAPFLTLGGTPISLDYHDSGLEVARWNIDHLEQVVCPPIDNSGDYDETLALIAELDHVVTVQTTVAHACGSMGKKATVIVNNIPAWRYQYGGDSLMWYPENSVRIYRQARSETGWQHVIARAVRDYQTFVFPRIAEAA